MRKFLHFPTLLVLLVLTACSKNKDKTAPVVVIQSPAAGNSFLFLDKVPIEIRVSDNEMISEVKYTMHLLDNSQFVFFLINQTVTPNKPEYSTVFSYQIGISVKGTYKLTVTAIDKSGNRTVEDRLIYVNQ